MYCIMEKANKCVCFCREDSDVVKKVLCGDLNLLPHVYFIIPALPFLTCHALVCYHARKVNG